MNKPISPCYKCDKRSPGCHSICGRYSNYIQLQKEFNERIAKKKKLEDTAVHWSKTIRKKLFGK